MKKILVTGCEGFLASRFIDYYKDTFNITGVSHHTLDITNEQAVFTHFKHHTYDLIFHTAALSDTGYCAQHPEKAHLVNTIGTQHIANGCAMQNATLIFASSDQVFNGNLDYGPYSETTQPQPNTPYAHSKREAELFIERTLSHYYNLRLTWLFTLPERHKKINPNILMNIRNALLSNTPLTLCTHEFRGMTYVYDVIEQFESILNLPSGNYNYGSENNLSTYEIGQFILKSMGLEYRIPDIIIPNTETFKNQPRDLRISNELLQSHNLFFPTTEQGLSKCLGEF